MACENSEDSCQPERDNPAALILAPTIHRIVLTGFMAAGKTTVGRLLANRLRWRFIDADDHIQTAAGMSVAEIFDRFGETDFRAREQQAIAGLLTTSSPSEDALVLAMGGGAIEDLRTLNLLLNSPGTHLIYLDVSLETTLARCGSPGQLSNQFPGQSSAVRPVLADLANLESRYLRRLPLYRQSHHTIVADHLEPAAIVESILTHLQSLHRKALQLSWQKARD